MSECRRCGRAVRIQRLRGSIFRQTFPDVAPIHDRQMVILERADWPAWLDLTRPEAELLRPLPAGSLTVEQVRP